MPRGRRHLATIACALLLFAAQALPVHAASAPKGPLEMLTLQRVDKNTLLVTETVSQPGQGRYTLLPGAYDASVPAGLVSLANGYFRVTPGVTAGKVQYKVPFPSDGLHLKWSFPTPVSALWLLVGKGVRLPVILNQSFFSAPGTVWEGVPYKVYGAQNLHGTITLNLQAAQPTAAPRQMVLPWLWAIPVALLGYWLVRGFWRRRNYA